MGLDLRPDPYQKRLTRTGKAEAEDVAAFPTWIPVGMNAAVTIPDASEKIEEMCTWYPQFGYGHRLIRVNTDRVQPTVEENVPELYAIVEIATCATPLSPDRDSSQTQAGYECAYLIPIPRSEVDVATVLRKSPIARDESHRVSKLGSPGRIDASPWLWAALSHALSIYCLPASGYQTTHDPAGVRVVAR